MNAASVFMLAGLALSPLLSAQAVELNDQFSLLITPTLVSDYRANGLSQTKGDPAAQLAVTLSHASGLYAGIWTSNVNFGYGSKARQEIEYYAGYAWQINDNISLDTFYTRYEYPRESGYNQSDVQTVLDVYGVLLGANMSPTCRVRNTRTRTANFMKVKKTRTCRRFLSATARCCLQSSV